MATPLNAIAVPNKMYFFISSPLKCAKTTPHKGVVAKNVLAISGLINLNTTY